MAAILFTLILLWHGVLGTMRARIEADLSLRPDAGQLPPGGSVVVGTSARLLQRQTQELAFTPNDPSFYPTGLARRTPAFQAEVVHSIAQVVEALAAGGTSEQLTSAAALLQTPPETWWLRPAMPPIGRPAERVYADAIESLVAHNQALAGNESRPPAPTTLPPEARAALAVLLERVEAQAIAGDAAIREGGEENRGVRLAAQRGTAFSAAMLMRALRDDNIPAIRLSGRAARWGEAIDQLSAAAAINPAVTRDNDLVRSGYALLLAANAMRAILDAPPVKDEAA